MKDIRDLADEEKRDVFRLLKPIGYEEGDKLQHLEILTSEDGSVKLVPFEEESDG